MKEYVKNNIPLAKELRKNMTPWENKLWYQFLRAYPVRFQRQKCIDNYIVDFYCAKAGLAVELDGGGHYEPEQAVLDEIRTKALEDNNVKVLRICNTDVDKNFREVCEAIDMEVKKHLPLTREVSAKRTEGETDNYPSVSCADSSPDKGSYYAAHHSSKDTTMKTVTIYTDGACSGNPGPGGWGAILMYGAYKKEMSGGEQMTTNNRMELMGVISALQALKEPCIVELWSDSKYVIDALQKGWAVSWRARGWRKADKKPALNIDLWEVLLALTEKHEMRYHWVKGHAENPYNNRCDELAVMERDKFA